MGIGDRGFGTAEFILSQLPWLLVGTFNYIGDPVS